MTREHDWEAFVELMGDAAVKTAMPNGKDIGRVCHVFFEELSEWPFEAVRDAVLAHCRAERFFPSLSDIVGRIEGTEEDRAMVMWALVLRTLDVLGGYCSVRFPDARIHWAIRQMGGWIHLSRTLTSDNERFVARDFARWLRLADRAVEAGADMPPYLVGSHERNNGYRRTVWDAVTRTPIQGEAVPALPKSSGDFASYPVRALVSGIAAGMRGEEARA
ncbi:MAG: hypothetical protein IJR14_06945 [Synergistaceae bacterium]|nr:hypothetical protein [Synergistaceae bacterium]